MEHHSDREEGIHVVKDAVEMSSSDSSGETPTRGYAKTGAIWGILDLTVHDDEESEDLKDPGSLTIIPDSSSQDRNSSQIGSGRSTLQLDFDEVEEEDN